MPIYTGNTRDGSDIREVQGMYVSKDKNEWSNKPYPHHIEEQRLWNVLSNYLKSQNRQLSDEYTLVLLKKSILGRALRNKVVEWFETSIEQNEETEEP